MKFQLPKVYPFTKQNKWIITKSSALAVTSKEFGTRPHEQAFAGPVLTVLPATLVLL